MIAELTAAPAAATQSGLPIALTIAFAVTALVAICMVFVDLRRSAKLTPITGGLTAIGAVIVLAGTVLVGGSLSAAPAAVADDTITRSTSGTVEKLAVEKLVGLQLPTLELPEVDALP